MTDRTAPTTTGRTTTADRQLARYWLVSLAERAIPASSHGAGASRRVVVAVVDERGLGRQERAGEGEAGAGHGTSGSGARRGGTPGEDPSRRPPVRPQETFVRAF